MDSGTDDLSTPEKILVKFTRLHDGDEVWFKMKRTTRLVMLFEAYCEHRGTPLHQCRFIYWGKQMEHDHTPEDYNMQHENTIHVVPGLRGS
ncbi:hypothetical protein KVT40_004606 [Elsinoe batatas]|uniref:Ubiquitin-like domain-containing protein n=1 Tax=Elsinoe batatas TaxID=2601811 RepID=A0A8K0L2R3_9PEZI|nr:hypothetical protein KVT40_004606 [Elsinoe batatas]